MSIDQTDRVDAVAVEVSTGKVILGISDHMDWSDEAAHINALNEKLKAYLRFYRER